MPRLRWAPAWIWIVFAALSAGAIVRSCVPTQQCACAEMR